MSDYTNPPFSYMGSKVAALPFILPHLPYRDSFIDVFGGSGAVIFNRDPKGTEVFNDINGNIVNFYRVLRDPQKCEELQDLLSLTVHSREEWETCFATHGDTSLRDVERALRWFYTMSYSFSGFGKIFGREMNAILAGRINRKLVKFRQWHFRLIRITIENLDWRAVLKGYDRSGTVFYLDPPYYGTDHKYAIGMRPENHKEMLDRVFELKGFVAVSGYANPLYDSYKWTKRIEFSLFNRLEHGALLLGHKGSLAEDKQEVLYIKECNNGS